jgi:hypothetical protein
MQDNGPESIGRRPARLTVTFARQRFVFSEGFQHGIGNPGLRLHLLCGLAGLRGPLNRLGIGDRRL